MNLIQSVSFVSSTTESLQIPSHVLEAAHYFKEYCYEEIHFIIICHHWTLKIGISWRFTEHFAAVFSACRVSTQLPGVFPISKSTNFGVRRRLSRVCSTHLQPGSRTVLNGLDFQLCTKIIQNDYSTIN